ncbi:hypothetical protein HFP72_18830 [Nocardiopsis sp. ARC36]
MELIPASPPANSTPPPGAPSIRRSRRDTKTEPNTAMPKDAPIWRK